MIYLAQTVYHIALIWALAVFLVKKDDFLPAIKNRLITAVVRVIKNTKAILTNGFCGPDENRTHI